MGSRPSCSLMLGDGAGFLELALWLHEVRVVCVGGKHFVVVWQRHRLEHVLVGLLQLFVLLLHLLLALLYISRHVRVYNIEKQKHYFLNEIYMKGIQKRASVHAQ